MAAQIKLDELAALVRAKRGTRGLRTVAQEIGGISASTLSRVERGEVPDLETFAQLCCWLGVSAEEFIPCTQDGDGGEVKRDEAAPATVPGMGTPEIIAAHLRADRTLTRETADALATMVRLAYEAVSRGEIGTGKRA